MLLFVIHPLHKFIAKFFSAFLSPLFSRLLHMYVNQVSATRRYRLGTEEK